MARDKSELCSSLMDGEPSDVTMKDGLASIARDNEAKRSWERFHLLSNLLRDEVSVLASPGFADRVAAAIEKEPHVVASTSWASEKTAPRSWLKQAVGLGVAASVAVLVTFSFQGPKTTDSGEAVVINPYNLPVSGVVPASAQVSMTRSLPSVDEQRRIQALLADHWQGAARETVQDALPYARLISLKPAEDDYEQNDDQTPAARR